MKREAIVNLKSIALNDKIKTCIDDRELPLSLFRASAINVARILFEGKAAPIEELEETFNKSIALFKQQTDRYIKINELRKFARVSIKRLLDYQEIPSTKHERLLKADIGFVNVSKIPNYKLMRSMVSRKIFDFDELNAIEDTIQKLHKLIADTDKEPVILSPLKNDVHVLDVDRRVNVSIWREHGLETIQRDLCKWITRYGMYTVKLMGFEMSGYSIADESEYYECVLTFKNLKIPLRVYKIRKKKCHSTSKQDH